MAVTIEELQIIVDAKVDKALKGLKKTDNATKDFKSHFLSMAKSVAGPAAAGLIIAKTIEMGAKFSKLAAGAEEIESKFKVVFGNSAGEVEGWAQTYSDSIGRSSTDTLEFLGNMESLLVPLLGNKKAADDLSKSTVTLANDLGSFNNIPTGDVLRDIQSAMVGNYEVSKKYGTVLNEDIVKQAAMNAGLWDGEGALSAAAKAQAVYNEFVRTNGAAMGDAVKTADSFTNTTKRLEAAQKELGIALGKNINEGMKPLVSATADITQALAEWINKNKDVKDFLDDMANGADISGKSIEELTSVIEAGVKANDLMSKGFGDQYSQDLIDAGKAATILLSSRQRTAAFEAQYADAIAKSNKDKAAAAALQIEISKGVEAAAKMSLQLAEDKLSVNQKELNATQAQINSFIELRDAAVKNSKEYNILQNTIDSLADKRKGLTDVIESAVKKEENIETETFKDTWLTKEDIAAQGLDNIDKWVEDYNEKQKIADTKELQDFKNKYNEKLSIISDISGQMEGIFSQLSTNEITNITNTEDSKIRAIEESYDAQLALMDSDSEEYSTKQKEKTDALKAAEDNKAKLLKTAKEKQWKIDKAFALSKATVDAITAVLEAAPNPWLMGAMGILGAASIAAIASEPMPQFAKGGEFITNGPQAIMVGDNPGGREKVTITPESSPNINGPQNGSNSGGGDVYLDGEYVGKWITAAAKDGKLFITEGALI